jgi:hypothetical protein
MAGRVPGSESRMLIDVKLVRACDAAADGAISPAAEELLARVAEQCPETATVAYVAG